MGLPSFDLPRIRLGLYFTFALFQFLLFALAAARLGYTLNLPAGDALNGGRDFYDPVIVDLLVNAICGISWSAYISFVIYTKRETGLPLITFRAELLGIGFLWLWLVIGTGIASSIWEDVNFCQAFEACRVLSALLAFAWLSWVTLCIIFGITFLFTYTGGAWSHALHGEWNPNSQPATPRTPRAMSERPPIRPF